MNEVERKPLWEWRATRRWSRVDLAKAANLSVATIESIERWRHPPSLKTMRAIAGVFGVLLDQIDWEAGRDAKILAPVA